MAVRNALVKLIRSDGSIRTTRTGQFGFFKFDDTELGETVVIEVIAKSYRFPPQAVLLADDVTYLEIAEAGESLRFR